MDIETLKQIWEVGGLALVLIAVIAIGLMKGVLRFGKAASEESSTEIAVLKAKYKQLEKEVTELEQKVEGHIKDVEEAKKEFVPRSELEVKFEALMGSVELKLKDILSEIKTVKGIVNGNG